MKYITIGQIAVACFNQADVTLGAHKEFSADHIIWAGSPIHLRDAAARKFAPLHPRYQKYYADALAILWQGKGIYRSGTECPVRAVKSLLPKGTEYIIVYRAIVEEE